MINNLIIKAKDLNVVRTAQEDVRERIEALEAALSGYPEWRELEQERENLSTLNKTEAQAKGELGELLVAAFNETGVKQYAGIGDVAVREVVEYSEADAVSWSIDKREYQLLKIDKKGFDKVAKVLKPAFVQVDEQPYARISSKIEVA